MNTTHLDALELHLSNERMRLSAAKSASEVKARKVWVAQLEREIAAEKAFLGTAECAADNLSTDDLLAALNA